MIKSFDQSFEAQNFKTKAFDTNHSLVIHYNSQICKQKSIHI